MGDKETTLPAAAASAASAPASAAPERVASPSTTAVAEVHSATPVVTAEPLPEGDVAVEADDEEDSESGYATSVSDQTSVSSSIYQGYLENGRRYQSKREEGYYIPADEQQFEHMSTLHVMYHILESQQPNPFFRSPISAHAQNILDIGTGNGAWARDVADLFPSVVVHGVDLYPPPDTWVPPNCIFEVDDVLKPWTYRQKFDLIHMRLLTGSFEPRQWSNVYTQTYEHLVPGGWIEQVEIDPGFYSDDGSMPLDSAVGQWGPLFKAAVATSGKPADMIYTMREKIEAAGFVNVQEKTYRVPTGTWAKHPLLKEAGKFNKLQFKEGIEGFAMYILTHFGTPRPWSAEEVQVYLAKIRKDVDSGFHIYQTHKRCWAQKPFDAEPPKETAGVEVVDVVA